jgi:glyoxylase-like metal-dependent hydrolase (beta-lactamase superfamily II)
MRFGDLELQLVNGGDFRLDGGAMHGVVPKAVWSRLVSCDAQNRCTYATNCLYVEGRGHRLLVETGNGDKFPAREKEIYGIDHDRSIALNLREAGIDPAGINLVVMTHLHFDHSGGATRRDGDRLAPVFANATHVVQAREWRDATHPHERNRASYLAENFLPLEAAGLVRRLEGETEVAPGITVLPTPGHTAGHQSVLIDDGHGRKLLFLGDVVPTALHTRLPFIMGYDLDVVGTLETKRALWRRALDEKWLLVFGHDSATRAGYLGLDAKGNHVIVEPVTI